MLLPVDEYLPGAVLPPHLSPFVETTEGGYVPPEKKRLINMKLGITDEQLAENQKAKETAKKQDSNEKKEKTNKQNATNSTANGNGKKHQEETKLTKTEKRKNEESDDDDEDEELLNDMKVDLDSPDEEQSEEESEDFSDSEEDEEANKKNKSQVTLRVSYSIKELILFLKLVKILSETNNCRG